MTMPAVTPLETLVKDYALEVGFDLVGISSADPFDAHKRVTLQRIRDGLMDGLPWFNPSRVERGSAPQRLLPGARSIISVALSYHLPYNGKPRTLQGRVARYAWGDDYHKLMKKRLKLYVRGLSERLDQEINARWYVDDGPMLDRAAAQRAGVGWFGKNTNILTSTHGSWVFLGQVITDLELKPDAPLKKNCGSCTLCLQSCPTGALPAPYVIDNERCISHQTIENRGDIPLEIRPLMSDWVFGCDICQDVCPVNVNALYTREQAFKKKRFTTLQLIEMLEMTDEEFRRRFSNSPLKRAKLIGLKRNACVALGNAGDPSAIPTLTRALTEDEPLVRRHAAWALGRIGGPDAHTALNRALPSETDPPTRQEIKSALAATNPTTLYPPSYSRENENPPAHPEQTPSAHPEPVEGSSAHQPIRHSRAGGNPSAHPDQTPSAHPEPVEGSSATHHSHAPSRHSRAGGNPSSSRSRKIPPTFIIRLATPDDAPRMLDIYAPIVRNTAISFETEPPTKKAFRHRIAETLQRLPWLACEYNGRVAGYAYATPFRTRAGYRWSVEVSVYVHEDFRGRHVATALYTSLLEGLRILAYFNAYAGISLPNPASVNLHERMGFKPVGTFPSVGYKLGEWHDVGFWRLTLQPHVPNPTSPNPLTYLLTNSHWKKTLKSAATIITP